MAPTELLAAQTIPTTNLQARKCMAPKVQVDDTSPKALFRMAGNSMSVPCVGAMIFCAALALRPKNV